MADQKRGSWYKFAVEEIEDAVKNKGRRLTPFEQQFMYGVPGNNRLPGVKRISEIGFKLSEKQEKILLNIHKRMTDVPSTWRRL